MKKLDIRIIAYNKYIVDWMLQRGYTIQDIIFKLSDIQNSNSTYTIEECFDDFEICTGFNGQVWVSYSEFLDYEYLDDPYMKNLLTREEWKLREIDLQNKEE